VNYSYIITPRTIRAQIIIFWKLNLGLAGNKLKSLILLDIQPRENIHCVIAHNSMYLKPLIVLRSPSNNQVPGQRSSSANLANLFCIHPLSVCWCSPSFFVIAWTMRFEQLQGISFRKFRWTIQWLRSCILIYFPRIYRVFCRSTATKIWIVSYKFTNYGYFFHNRLDHLSKIMRWPFEISPRNESKLLTRHCRCCSITYDN